MEKFSDEEKARALLVEYTAAQDSAQHHDSLVWTTTGMVWGAELVLIGFVMQTVENSLQSLIVLFASILAIVLLAYLWITFFSFRRIRNQKYIRCKEIEDIFDLKQHKNLVHKENLGFLSYNFVMFIFCLMWILIFVNFV